MILFLRWLLSEAKSIVFIIFFTFFMLSASSKPWLVCLIIGIMMSVIYLIAIVGHESAHYFAARLRKVDAEVSWLPRPTVNCSNLSFRSARLVAIAGPATGVVISVLLTSWLIVSLKLSIILSALGATISLMHLGMLLPTMPDGKMLFIKKVNHKEGK